MAHKKNPVKILLGWLLAIVAVNAFGGGWYGLAGAEDVPTEWLQGSLFPNYFIPSIILLVFVGGTCTVASVLVFKNSSWGPVAAFGAGAVLMAWIVVQLSIIGYVSWMQPAMFITATIILILSLFLKVNNTPKDSPLTFWP